MRVAKRWTVVYQMPGTERWTRSEPTPSRDGADTLRASLERAGYVTLGPQDYDQSLRIGLPEGKGK